MKAETIAQPIEAQTKSELPREDDLCAHDSRPVIICECAFWGAPCPHLFSPETGADPAHLAALRWAR